MTIKRVLLGLAVAAFSSVRPACLRAQSGNAAACERFRKALAARGSEFKSFRGAATGEDYWKGTLEILDGGNCKANARTPYLSPGYSCSADVADAARAMSLYRDMAACVKGAIPKDWTAKESSDQDGKKWRHRLFATRPGIPSRMGVTSYSVSLSAEAAEDSLGEPGELAYSVYLSLSTSD